MYHRRKAVLAILTALISACHAGSSRAVAQLHIPSTPLPILPTVLVSRFPSHQVDLVAIPTQTDVCSEASNPTSPQARLRNAMKNSTYTHMQPPQGYFDAFLIFYTDEHLTEEPAAEERRLEYFSGWDGPGTGVVLAEGGAAIWVPGRDLDRARRTVSCGWLVLDADDSRQPTIADWISERIGRSGRVGGDARHATMSDWRQLTSALKSQYMQLVHKRDLLDQLWYEEPDPARARPQFSKIIANVHNREYTGVSWREKVSALRAKLRELDADAMVVTALDEVAWLLNVRGRDVPTAPLLKAFVVVSMMEVRVYTPQGKLSMPIREVLAVYNCHQSNDNCTRVLDYPAIYTDLHNAPVEWKRVLIPEAGTIQRGASAAIEQSVLVPKRFYELSPIIYLKAAKNNAEIEGMNQAHLRDAVAMCTLLSYLETTFRRRGLTEISVAKSVDENRVSQANYISTSMKTRVSFGVNGAIPDYMPTNATNRRVFANSTLVIRSGGQYDEGTTVVTRTIHFGSPTREEKQAYTITLRSLIAMAMLNAPTELPAAHMDPVARAPLWVHKQDYPHPTGYGVGAALMRREGPVVLDYRHDTNLHSLKEGYFITVEPAWYQSGKFGIGLGNILQVVSIPSGYIGFNETTLVPYEPKLIEKSMLTDYEIMWLNNYYIRIRKQVGKELESRGMLKEYYWMMNKTVAMELPSKIKRYPSNATPPRGHYNSANTFFLTSASILTVVLYMF